MAELPMSTATQPQLALFLGDGNVTQFFKTAVLKDLDGNVIDFSAWNSIAASIRTTDGTNWVMGSVTPTGNADGTIDLAVANVIADYSGQTSAQMLVHGKVGSSDATQLIARLGCSFSR
jgi:hypothetical protein